MCMFCRSLFVLLYFFLWPLCCLVLLRYTDFDYPFGILKLFLDQYFKCRTYMLWIKTLRDWIIGSRVIVFNATFNNISVTSISWSQFYWWKKPEYQEKTTDLSQVNDKLLSHKCCIQYTSPWAGFKLALLVVIDTDCIGSGKSNYHSITTTAFCKGTSGY